MTTLTPLPIGESVVDVYGQLAAAGVLRGATLELQNVGQTIIRLCADDDPADKTKYRQLYPGETIRSAGVQRLDAWSDGNGKLAVETL